MKKIYWLLLVFLMNCKEKYTPELHIPSLGYLVVEGFINASGGPTDIVLTRVAKLDSISIIPEHGAEVDVQSENGTSYPLTENTAGHYSIDQITLNAALTYRLHIKTSNGKEYLSDLSEVKITPPIDSVSWKEGPDDLGIFVSTHDDQKNAIYYQWEFDETWQYNSGLESEYIRTRPTVILPRTPSQSFPPYCWSSDSSTEILISSSAKLSADVIYEFPLTKISYSTTNKLSLRYSILVKQFTLTKEGYEWQQKIQKNTEQLGSIFDAQPSEVSGNIHSTTDPGETVIGFIGCTSETVKRIFIDRSDLQISGIYTGYEECTERQLPWYNAKTDSLLAGSGTVITGVSFTAGMEITGLSIAPLACVDCRLKGGTATKPDFW